MNSPIFRIRTVGFFFFVFGALIAVRTLYLQFAFDDKLARLSKRQFDSKLTSLPRRGFILDRNGEGLAVTLKVRSLFIRPELLHKDLSANDRSRLATIISKAIRWPKAKVIEKFHAGKNFVWIKRQLSPSEESFLTTHQILDFGDAVGLVEETRRFYPNKELASHVLGSVGIDGQGLEGLELLFDAILSGEKTKISSTRDAVGRRIFRGEDGLFAFKDGQSLVLTLDRTIQYDAEKALAQAVHEHQAKAGTVIVAEVETGEILAMANVPTFNPNTPKNFPADWRRNRAITDTFEPGSTFKPLLMGLAFEHGKTIDSKMYCEMGSFHVADRTISEAETHDRWGWLSYGEIVKLSSNIGAAKIALELGAPALSQFADRLGVERKTGIDLPGEVFGQFSSAQAVSPVRLANVGFGQGFTVTPIQMLSFYLAIANGGEWIQPRVVKAILKEDPDSLEHGAVGWSMNYRFEHPKTRRIFDAKIDKEITAALAMVTAEGGTGVDAQLDEWPVAGKTGTAQKIDPISHRYSKTKFIASFAGFAPRKKPKLVALVMLDEPLKGSYAAQSAAPLFRDVMRSALIREQVPPADDRERVLRLANQSSLNSIAEQDTQDSAPSSKDSDAKTPLKVARSPDNQLLIPDLRGLSIREALRAVGGAPVKVDVIGSGLVREQLPQPNGQLEPGGKLLLRCADAAN